MSKTIKIKLIWFTYLCQFFVFTNHVFSEESSTENKFSGNWIEYTSWGFQIKRISEGTETLENYNEFGKLTSKKTLNLSFPNEGNTEGEYLIKPNSNWHYLTGKKKPDNLKWASINFDATKGNWKQGEAGFGYADNDDKTILNDMVNEYQSVFIRKEFTIQKEMDLSRLMLAINFDDSFALHLNGRYIFSINIVGENGQVKVTDHEATGFEFFPLKSYTDALNIGKNVIGLEGYNKDLGSSDFTLDPYLVIGGGYTNYSKNDPENNTKSRGGYLIRDNKLQEFIASEEQGKPSTQKTFFSLDSPEESLLHAARNGEKEKIAKLLNDGVKIDFSTEESYTALGYASAKGNLELMQFLLKKGADINNKSRNDKSPILVVAGTKHINAAKMLIKNGADINIINGQRTCLHEAAYWRQPETLQFFIDQGIDSNTKGFYNITPLHWAVYPMKENDIERNQKSIDCIKILLQNGAKKSNKVNGKTAADWATERNLSDIAKMLAP